MSAVQNLPPLGLGPESVHVWGPGEQLALKAAHAARRPLLLRGEPGSGKTQLARAAAEFFGRALVYQVVDASTEATDLLYWQDPVARLAEAQCLAARAAALGPDEARAALHPRNFVRAGALWWGFNWEQAQGLAGERPDRWFPERAGRGVVVLIDEIDKADPSVPSALLDALGHGGFGAPGWGRVQAGTAFPLVLLTTNEERSLPAAFLRRCLVLQLSPPLREEDFRPWVLARAQAHFPGLSPEVHQQALDLLWADRQDCRELNLPAPGLAEHLDLLRVLSQMVPPAEQQGRIRELSLYTFRKHQELGPRS
jgi:MoxR-like ATPase